MNLANYNQVLNHITLHPETHDQNTWCGTAMCFAGHAQAMAGKPMNKGTVQKDAKAWLGINNAVAYVLFDGDCTLDNMRDLADAYKHGENAALYLAAVTQNWRTLEYVPAAVVTEPVCLAAVQQNGYALQYVPAALVTEPMCLAAVQQNGYALEYAPAALVTEPVCLAAVQQNGYALEYVPAALRARIQELLK